MLKTFKLIRKGFTPISKLFDSKDGRYGERMSPIKLPIIAHVKINITKYPLLRTFPNIDFSPLDNNYSIVHEKLNIELKTGSLFLIIV
jgi:hypothetical protein